MRRSGDPRSTPRVGGTERPEWLYIAFEGGEGSGKSTQAERLASRLGAVLTREPGGTAIGGRLRELLLDPSTEDLDARAETLLMAADRAQHRAEVVAPTLASGRHVVSDRSVYSSLAYQGAGEGSISTRSDRSRDGRSTVTGPISWCSWISIRRWHVNGSPVVASTASNWKTQRSRPDSATPSRTSQRRNPDGGSP